MSTRRTSTIRVHPETLKPARLEAGPTRVLGCTPRATEVPGLLVEWVLLIGIGAVGCASTPPVPPDPELRELATRYVEMACRYPENPAVRAQAMEAASEVLGDEARLRIREGLEDDHPGVRFAACMALGMLKDTGALPSIRALANDPDPNVRVGAYFALERMGDYSYRVAWRDLLCGSDDPEVRRNATLALGHLGNKEVMPLLRHVAAEDRDDGVRLQALEALALLGDRGAINRFEYDAFGGVGFKQPFALLTLGRASDPALLPRLRARLRSAPYLEARLAAARSLGMQGYDDGYALALKSLTWNKPVEGLADDPPDNQIMRVRSMAALALGDIGDRRALGRLKVQMETPDDPRVQLAAATAILKILNAYDSNPETRTGQR
jgi:HEAT repeat protein